ncbi:MAG: putative ABC-type transport system involved in lysophospholipase L1 biosynthesis ATPase subunit, partial [Planctomycetota bacterium]
NVLVPTLVYPKGEQRRTACDRASEMLNDVGLGERLHHRPAQLSGGEQQRVAVIRALINQPRIVLADEPTGSLDERGTDSLGDLLCQLNERHSVALVTVTHSRRLATRMQRILELREGSIATADQNA